MEDGGLWIEDSIMPHQHLINIILFVLCRESRYFEDIVKFTIFRLRTIYNFFQAWESYDSSIWKPLVSFKSSSNFFFLFLSQCHKKPFFLLYKGVVGKLLSRCLVIYLSISEIYLSQGNLPPSLKSSITGLETPQRFKSLFSNC